MAVVIIANIRCIVFYFYAKNNKRAHVLIMLTFQVALLVAGIILWEDFIGFLLVVGSMISGVATWQKSMFWLRVLSVLCSVLFIINYTFNGLYTTIIGEGFAFASEIISLFIYHIIPHAKNKKEKKISNNTYIQNNANKISNNIVKNN